MTHRGRYPSQFGASARNALKMICRLHICLSRAQIPRQPQICRQIHASNVKSATRRTDIPHMALPPRQLFTRPHATQSFPRIQNRPQNASLPRKTANAAKSTAAARQTHTRKRTLSADRLHDPRRCRTLPAPSPPQINGERQNIVIVTLSHQPPYASKSIPKSFPLTLKKRPQAKKIVAADPMSAAID